MSLSRSLLALMVITVTLSLLPVTQAFAKPIVDCFQCHDRAAFQKRVKHEPAAAGECLDCHNPHVARFKGLLQKKVKDLCYSCHTDAAEQHSKGVVHMPVKDGNCLGCHDPHSSDQDGLLKGRLADVCFSCHTDLPKKFKHTHPPYAKGECTACHQPHQSANNYLLVKNRDALCYNCHKQAAVQKKHPNFPMKLSNCGSCHNPHGSNRPGLIRNVLHPPYADDCSNCHTGKGVPVRMETCLGCHPDVGEQMASSHNHLVRYKQNLCTACHSPHAGDDKRLLRGKERHVCGTCHESTFKRRDAAKYKHPMKGLVCNDCHAPHGSNHPAMAKGPINDVCNQCHGKHGMFSHPIGNKVYDPRTGQVMTCISCHATKGSDYKYHTRYDGKKALCVQCHDTYR